MDQFQFPTNIKQIGSIGDGMRVYIEDYAYTYLQQYAQSGGYEDRLALLVGRAMVIDGQKVLFISGAIRAQHTKRDKGITVFTPDAWDQFREDMRTYFRGLDVMGWAQSQPGYGTTLNQGYATFHLNNFTNPDQVMFVIDPIEKLNAFYMHEEKSKELTESRGYFIYYDKNQNMHEYMLDNKITVDLAKDLQTRSTEQIYEPEDMTESETEMAMETEYGDSGEEVLRKSLTPKMTVRRAMFNQRRSMNMLTSLCAVLLVICFILGAGLIQSDGRLSDMEHQVVKLNTAYRDLIVQTMDGKTEAVFATQNGSASNTDESDAESWLVPVDKKAESNTDVTVTAGPEQASESTAEPIPEPTIKPTTQPTPEQTPEPVSDLNVEPSQESALEAAVAPAEPVVKYPDVPDSYVVSDGDSLWDLSRRFYGTAGMIERIMEVNSLDDPTMLKSGKTIVLPKY